MQPNDGRVVSNFIVQALSNNPITVYGAGNQTRSFCYVDDMIRGFIMLMDSPPEFIGPTNLGNPDEFTILQLANAIVRLTDSRSEIVFKALPSDDPTRRCPDISLAQERLDWRPSVSLEKGLISTVAYFRERLNVS